MLEEYISDLQQNTDTEALVDKHRADIEYRLSINFGKFEILSISTKLLAGIEHEIMLKNDDGRIIKVFIYESLPHCRHHTNMCHAILMNRY